MEYRVSSFSNTVIFYGYYSDTQYGSDTGVSADYSSHWLTGTDWCGFIFKRVHVPHFPTLFLWRHLANYQIINRRNSWSLHQGSLGQVFFVLWKWKTCTHAHSLTLTLTHARTHTHTIADGALRHQSTYIGETGEAGIRSRIRQT